MEQPNISFITIANEKGIPMTTTNTASKIAKTITKSNKVFR